MTEYKPLWSFTQSGEILQKVVGVVDANLSNGDTGLSVTF